MRRALRVRGGRRAQPAGGHSHGELAWSPGLRPTWSSLRVTKTVSSRCSPSGARTPGSSSRRHPRGRRFISAQLGGGFLAQQAHHFAAGRDQWRVVTKAAPTEEQWPDAELAWRVCGHVRSNAIVLVRNGQAVGIGAGQQNRVEAGEIAAKKAAGRARGGACASDAFYPFPDGVEAAARSRCRGGDPTGRWRCMTTRSSRPPTGLVLRWSSPARGTSFTDDVARRCSRLRVLTIRFLFQK